MSRSIDLSRLIPCSRIVGEDDEETESLKMMCEEAEAYVRSFRWCPPINEKYLGYGVGGVIGAFLFHFDRPIKGTDEWLWVVVGDLPSAYFVVDEAPDAAAALKVYCNLMEEWAKAVLAHQSLEGVFPVQGPATDEIANRLLSRTKFIRERIIPSIT